MLEIRITNCDLWICHKPINLQLYLPLITPVVVPFTDGDILTAGELITAAEVQRTPVVVAIRMNNANFLWIARLEFAADCKRAVRRAILADKDLIREISLLRHNRVEALANVFLLIVGEDAARDDRILANALRIDIFRIVVPLFVLTDKLLYRLAAQGLKFSQQLFFLNHSTILFLKIGILDKMD